MVNEQPNDAKFVEMVLYISSKLANDRYFGDTKLNKVLFWADFRAYAVLGRAVTFHRYQKQKFGPTAIALLPVRRKMIVAGICETAERDVGMSHPQRRTIPLRDADLSVFSEGEKEIIDQAIERMRPQTAGDTRDMSHNFAGWQMMNMGETIPYETVFLVKRRLTSQEEEWASEIEPRYQR